MAASTNCILIGRLPNVTWSAIRILTAFLTDQFIDYATFAHPSFDANEYANAILANQAYRPSDHHQSNTGTAITSNAVSTVKAGQAPEEISVFLAKLSFGIDDVNRQLKNVINVHHEKLLEQAASVNQLEGTLGAVKNGLKDIDGSVTRPASFHLYTPPFSSII